MLLHVPLCPPWHNYICVCFKVGKALYSSSYIFLWGYLKVKSAVNIVERIHFYIKHAVYCNKALKSIVLYVWAATWVYELCSHQKWRAQHYNTTEVSVFPQLSECRELLRNIGQNYPPNGIFYVCSGGDSHRVRAVKISQPRFKDKQTDGVWSQLGHAPVTGVYFNRQKIQWLHSGKKPPNLLWSSSLCGR